MVSLSCNTNRLKDIISQCRHYNHDVCLLSFAVKIILQVVLPTAGELRFDLRVLGSATGRGLASTLHVHVAAPDGTTGQRPGNLTMVTTRTEALNCTSAFTVAVGEDSLQLRVLVDRSILEVFAANGRAVLTGRDYPAQDEVSAHLTVAEPAGAESDAPVPLVTFRRVDAWAMDCAWRL